MFLPSASWLLGFQASTIMHTQLKLDSRQDTHKHTHKAWNSLSLTDLRKTQMCPEYPAEPGFAPFPISVGWPLPCHLTSLLLCSCPSGLGWASHPAPPWFPAFPILLVLTSSWNVSLLCWETDFSGWKSCQPFQACSLQRSHYSPLGNLFRSV